MDARVLQRARRGRELPRARVNTHPRGMPRHDTQRTPITSPRDESPTIHGAPAGVHLVCGPVGAGKSTYATRLAREQRAVRLTLDEWMARLFRSDRPESGIVAWYRERAARSVAQIWSVSREVLAAEVSVVLESGLLARAERASFYAEVEHAGYELSLHIIDAARDVRRARVLERNRLQGATFSMVVPPEVFELASDLWEPPNEAELARRNVRLVRTDRPCK